MEMLSIGADPEVFVQRNGDIIPVVGLLGGTKREPLPVAGGAVQEDNVLAEFNIEPCTNEEEWITRLCLVMCQLEERLGAPLVIKSSHNFDQGVLLSAGPQAMTFGCSPDLNAWTRTKQYPPQARTLRTAGGHIHVGCECSSPAEAAEVVKRMDLFLGVPSLLMDDDTQRRTLYGKAGSFRKKPYGFEYRTLSNFWIADEAKMKWAYRQTQRAVLSAVDVPSSVSEIINNNNVAAAMELINEFGLEVV